MELEVLMGSALFGWVLLACAFLTVLRAAAQSDASSSRPTEPSPARAVRRPPGHGAARRQP